MVIRPILSYLIVTICACVLQMLLLFTRPLSRGAMYRGLSPWHVEDLSWLTTLVSLDSNALL
jgi:hypothetical protein